VRRCCGAHLDGLVTLARRKRRSTVTSVHVTHVSPHMASVTAMEAASSFSWSVRVQVTVLRA
jgi:hypothetical protein